MDTISFFDSTELSRDTAGVLSRIAGEFVIVNFLINFSRVFVFIPLKFKWEIFQFNLILSAVEVFVVICIALQNHKFQTLNF